MITPSSLAAQAASLLFLLPLPLLAADPPANAKPLEGVGVATYGEHSYYVAGDILIRTDSVSGPTRKTLLEKLAEDGERWPGGVVYYQFDNGVAAAYQELFRQTIEDWTKHSAIRFLSSSIAPDRMVVYEAQPADIVGCGDSVLGHAGGPQPLRIRTTCWNERTILHEVGHALGFMHEHQRADRDDFVMIEDEGNYAGADPLSYEVNFGKVNATERSAYDFLSVMQYPSDAHFTAHGVQYHFRIRAKATQPPGLPAGSQSGCVTITGCEDAMGANTLSARDGFGAGVAYGRKLDLLVVNPGFGSVTVTGDSGTCGQDCFRISHGDLASVVATPLPGVRVALLASDEEMECLDSECVGNLRTNTSVVVRFVPLGLTLNAIFLDAPGYPIFEDDFESSHVLP